jgi:hypothetical protein
MATTLRKRLALQLLCLIASALLFTGCATEHPENGSIDGLEHQESRAYREQRLQATWRGRSYHSLLQKYGTPKMVMTVPGYRPLQTSVIVFGVIDRASDCIDAFTVVTEKPTGDMTVADYFCR